MRFTTITAKYPGTCRRCGGAVEPGTRVRYNGRGLWHLSAQCPAGAKRPSEPPASDRAAGELMAYGDPFAN